MSDKSTAPPAAAAVVVTLAELRRNVRLLSRAAENPSSNARLIARCVRLTTKVRKHVTPALLARALPLLLPPIVSSVEEEDEVEGTVLGKGRKAREREGRRLREMAGAYMQALAEREAEEGGAAAPAEVEESTTATADADAAAVEEAGEQEMEVEGGGGDGDGLAEQKEDTPAGEEKKTTKKKSSASSNAAALPEIEAYLCLLCVTTLLRYGGKYDEEAALLATALVERLKSFNRRTLDAVAAKAHFYLSLAYERLGRLQNVRALLLAGHRTACLNHDDIGQSMLLNLLLRNYLHYNQLEAAHQLVSRTSFPESASNAQFCRYLYYVGRIQAVQQEYSESFMRLSQALRKAPTAAKGYMVTVQQLAIIVQLLMGDIPERSIFLQPEMRVPLQPYLELTQAVRAGSLGDFNRAVDQFRDRFLRDKNLTLIQRLAHNVIKTGLRKINVSYSRISLADIAQKLAIDDPRTAEFICAKAIRDGVIEATLDHENQWLMSKETADVYSTDEPQRAFHRRIAFCLDVHNDAVKAMRYPPDEYKRQLAKAKKEKKGEDKSEDEIVKEIQDELDEEEG